CAGRPVAAVHTRIVRIEKGPIKFDSWEALAPQDGRIGELIVSGPHVCRDYFRNPGAVAENKILDAEGVCWHRMGDTGYMDARGRFWLTGRVHSTILCKGAPLHSQLLEARIAAHAPGAIRAAALEHDGRLIVVVQGQPVPNLLQRLRADGVPADEVLFTFKTLPLDPRHQAKIDYAALRRMVAGGRV
ncbi:MAG: AMP-binding protein, partial [Patescibacteria group bacterium]|nr:AMP-binding protein [Patescibacteria group bacterium]